MNNWLDPNTDTLIGDFNCALNSNLNRFNCASSGDIGKVDIQQLKQQHNLEDVWRKDFQIKKNNHGREVVKHPELIIGWFQHP